MPAENKLAGRPDLIFPKYDAVIFVHGCFWHGHNCHLFKWPGTREEFWRGKISANEARDKTSSEALHRAGWRIGVVWECVLKGRQRRPSEDVLNAVSGWLMRGTGDLSLEGVPEHQTSEPAI